eukprot:UN27755
MYHTLDIVEKRKSRKKYDLKVVNPNALSEEEVAYRTLEKWYRDNGFFEPDMGWLTWRFFLHLMNIIAVFWLAGYGNDDLFCRCIGGILLGVFWQQNGFFMHDFEHCQHFQNREWDTFFGSLTGTVGFGISGTWWRFEHNEHHLFTNTYIEGVGPCDPQMQEETWIINAKPGVYQIATNLLTKLCVPVQHIIYLPGCVLFGRIAILIAGLIRERSQYEKFLVMCHWAWVLCLLWKFDTWNKAFQYWFIGAFYQGFYLYNFYYRITHNPIEKKRK